MSNGQIFVFPGQRVTSFDGTNPSQLQAASVPSMSIADALTCPTELDARAVPYSIEGAIRLPRLKKESLSFFKEAGVPVVVDYAFIDVDLPGHRPWNEGELEEILSSLETLPEWESAAFYQTPHGYRLLWRLDTPIPAQLWRAWFLQFSAHLSNYGIDVDPGCREWNRLYRLPRATREDDFRPLDLHRDFERFFNNALTWEPVGELREEHVGAAFHYEYAPEPPTDIEPVSKALLRKCKDVPYYTALCRKQPLAEPGKRRSAVFSCAGMVGAALDTDDPVLIYRIMLPAIKADVSTRNAQGELDPPPGEEILWEACTFVARRQSARKEENAALRDALYRNLRTKTHDHLENVLTTDDEEDEVADYTPESDTAITQRIILADPQAKSFYVLHEKEGTYEGPIGAPLIPATVDNCSPTLGSTIITSPQGKIRALNEILRLCGTSVDRVVAILGQRETTYHPGSGTLYEGIAAMRTDLTPTYHADVNDWLLLLGGHNHGELLNWLATFTDLSRPTCALYLQGGPGCGKGMLAGGISRIYGAPPASYAEFVGSFNSSIQYTPIIWADEKMPQSRFGQSTTEVFRSLVGNSDFTLSRKFLPNVLVQGSLRLVVTANNADALGIGENLGPADYEAVVRRVGYIRSNPKTAEWLEQKGGRNFTEDWVSGDKIAEHVLWLRDNRSVTPGSRYLVEGWETPFHRNLNLNLGSNQRTLETLAYIVCSGVEDEGVFVGNGAALVTLKAVARTWPAAVGIHKDPPGRKTLAQAMRNFTLNKARVETKLGSRSRCLEINLDEVMRCADELDMVDDIDAVMARVSAQTSAFRYYAEPA